MEEELLKLILDYVFKRGFSEISRPKGLAFLLQTILRTNIKDFKHVHPEVPRENPESKTVIYDISVKLDDDTRVDVEMQPHFRKEHIDRMFYYGTRLMHLKRGNDYFTLNKGAVIVFVNDKDHFFPYPVSAYVQGEWKGDSKHILTEKLIYYFIAMNRIDEIEISKENEDLILLLKFLTTTRRDEMETLAQKNEGLKEIFEVVVEMSQNPEERAIANARDKFLWDLEVSMKVEREEGRIEGEEIGEKRGIEIGEKRGRMEGAIQTAKAMIAAGFDIETICKATGLSPEDLT